MKSPLYTYSFEKRAADPAETPSTGIWGNKHPYELGPETQNALAAVPKPPPMKPLSQEEIDKANPYAIGQNVSDPRAAAYARALDKKSGQAYRQDLGALDARITGEMPRSDIVNVDDAKRHEEAWQQALLKKRQIVAAGEKANAEAAAKAKNKTVVKPAASGTDVLADGKVGTPDAYQNPAANKLVKGTAEVLEQHAEPLAEAAASTVRNVAPTTAEKLNKMTIGQGALAGAGAGAATGATVGALAGAPAIGGAVGGLLGSVAAPVAQWGMAVQDRNKASADVNKRAALTNLYAKLQAAGNDPAKLKALMPTFVQAREEGILPRDVTVQSLLNRDAFRNMMSRQFR